MFLPTRMALVPLLAVLAGPASAQELSLRREVATCMVRKKNANNRCREMMTTQRLEKARRDVAAAIGEKPVQEQIRLTHALVMDPSYEPSLSCPPFEEKQCVRQAVDRCFQAKAPKASEIKDPEALKAKEAQVRERCETAGSKELSAK